MDENTVKQHAEAHGNAVVAGDLRTAGSDLTPAAADQAPGVMGKLPRPTTGAEILKVEVQGDEAVVHVLYKGEDAETTVISTWADEGGRPKIVNLSSDNLRPPQTGRYPRVMEADINGSQRKVLISSVAPLRRNLGDAGIPARDGKSLPFKVTREWSAPRRPLRGTLLHHRPQDQRGPVRGPGGRAVDMGPPGTRPGSRPRYATRSCSHPALTRWCFPSVGCWVANPRSRRSMCPPRKPPSSVTDPTYPGCHAQEARTPALRPVRCLIGMLGLRRHRHVGRGRWVARGGSARRTDVDLRAARRREPRSSIADVVEEVLPAVVNVRVTAFEFDPLGELGGAARAGIRRRHRRAPGSSSRTITWSRARTR